MLRPLALLALVAPALAEEPPGQVVNELAEIRERVGGSVVGDRADFAEALRRVAGNEGRAAVGDRFADPRFHPPARREGSMGHPRQPVEQPFDERFQQPGRGFGPWHGPPEPPRPNRQSGPPSAKVMLREAAFQLDRLAHELEMAELLDEADELRDSANKLRKSARKASDNGGDAGSDDEHSSKDRDRKRRAERQEQVLKERRRMEKRVREAQQRAEEAKRRATARELKAAERRKARGRRAKQRPAETGSAPPLEAVEVEGDDSLIPPPGVHGGPHEPAKPHNG